MAFPSGWGRKQKITIQSSQVVGSGSHSDFPVLVTLDHINAEVVDAGSNSALNGGGDIRFSSDAAGSTQLACEIVSFATSASAASRECEVWVKVPSVSTSANTDFYIWYKKPAESQPAASATYGSEAVWSDYDFMTHNMLTDSTGNETITVHNAGTVTDSPWGKDAYLFDGSADRLSSTVSSISVNTDLTMSAWMRDDGNGSSFPRAVYLHDGSDWVAFIIDTDFGDGSVVWAGDNGTTDGAGPEDDGGAIDATWGYIVGTQTGNKAGQILRISKSDENDYNWDGWSASDTNVMNIGCRENGSNYFNGAIAHLGIRGAVVSSDVTDTEYNMMNAPASFASAGTSEDTDDDLSTWGRKQKITIDATQVSGSGSHTDFPVLITLDHLNSEIVDGGINSALDGGGDVRFSSDAAGTTKLPCEIVEFVSNATAGARRCMIWVKVPSLSTTADTDIYIWYNKAGVISRAKTDTYGAQNVWDSNYIVVAHDCAYNSVDDSNLTLTEDTNGVTTGQTDWLGHNTAVNFADHEDENYYETIITPLNGAWTMQQWAYAQGSNDDYDGFTVMMSNSSGDHVAIAQRDDGRWNFTSGAEGWAAADPGTVSINSWAKQDLKISGSNGTLKNIRDGSLLNTENNYDDDPDGKDQFTIGGDAGINQAHEGNLAEIRLSNIERSDDWCFTEWNNQDDPANFATAGTPETPSSDIELVIDAGSHSHSAENLTLTGNFPVADFSVQHISDDIGNSGGTNTSFTAVADLDNAFELANNNRKSHAGSVSSTGNMEGDDMAGGRVLTATGTLTYYRESGSVSEDMRFETSIVEYVGDPGGDNEFIVRGRFATALNGTTNSVTETLSGVLNADDCIPFVTGIMNNATSDDFDSSTAIAYLENATTLRVQKGSNGNNVTVYVTVVEFTGSNWTVLHGDSGNQSADTGSITLYDGADGTGTATDVSDWAQAVIIGHHRADTGASGTNDAIADTWPSFDPGSNDQTVDWTFDANHDSAGTNRHFVHVLDHADFGVTRYQSTSNTQGETTIDITSAGLTSTDQAVIVGSSISSGSGTALGRGSRNYYLNSTTEAAHWAHRSGNTMAHEIQIVDISALATSAGGDTLLVFAQGDHAHSSDVFSLGQVHILATSDAVHGQSAEPPDLVEHIDLAISAGGHGHVAGVLELIESSGLLVADSLHGQISDSFLIPQLHQLAIEDVIHSHAVENISFGGSEEITTQSSIHTFLDAGLTLGYTVELDILDASHNHFTDQILLNQNHVLLVTDNYHSQSSDTLLIQTLIEGGEALHGLTSDELDLPQTHILQDLPDQLDHLAGEPYVRIPPGLWGAVGEAESDWLTSSEAADNWSEQGAAATTWSEQSENSSSWSEQSENSNDWEEK